MTRFKLVLEYDGGPFVGWQRQDNGPSVQQALEEAVHGFCGETVVCHGAGRTDAGVHALGQVASLAAEEDLTEILYSVNAVLPDDVVVRSAARVPEGFHARRSAVRRHYRYRLHSGPTALERRTCLVLKRAPDAAAMARGARLLPGRPASPARTR